jgi:hypothetical protein
MAEAMYVSTLVGFNAVLPALFQHFFNRLGHELRKTLVHAEGKFFRFLGQLGVDAEREKGFGRSRGFGASSFGFGQAHAHRQPFNLFRDIPQDLISI